MKERRSRGLEIFSYILLSLRAFAAPLRSLRLTQLAPKTITAKNAKGRQV